MGIVKMRQEPTRYWEDLHGISPYDTAILYVYCDQCGSFRIRARLGPGKALLILFTFILIGIGISAVFQLTGGFFWLGVCLAVCPLTFRYFWGSSEYACQKCGSVPNLRFNTLSYPPDPAILDVPEQWAKKRTYGYWPERENIDRELMSAPGLPVLDDSAASKISSDLARIKTLLVSLILIIPALIYFVVVIPVLFILALIWNDVLARPVARLNPRNKI